MAALREDGLGKLGWARYNDGRKPHLVFKSVSMQVTGTLDPSANNKVLEYEVPVT